MQNRPVRAALAPVIVLAVAMGGVTGAAVVAPAMASGTHHAGNGRTSAAAASGRQSARQAQASPLLAGVALIAPLAWRGHLSPAAAGKAVSTCVFYAAKAGWPDNGYFGGDLVTAAAICVAESGGDPHLIVCDDGNGGITGQGDYPKFTCPQGTSSFDRGLWQLSSKFAAGVSNKCAFNPACNAGQAYLHSERGTSFAPWSSYDTDTYARPFLDLVQAAVTKHATGTVTSALLGECLAQSRPVAGAKVVIANCGSGAGSQQWSTAGGKLRSGSRCAAIASSGARPAVVLHRCGRARNQDWTVAGRDELRNAADGKCLTDPGSSVAAGTGVDVSSCGETKQQTWWLP